MNRNAESTELAWQAFRYIAAEMTSDETDAFELRLADDQTAREAVASVTALADATAVALSSSTLLQGVAAMSLAPQVSLAAADDVATSAMHRPAQRWWQPLAWMAVGAAASALVMSNLSALPTLTGPAGQIASVDPETSADPVAAISPAPAPAPVVDPPLPEGFALALATIPERAGADVDMHPYLPSDEGEVAADGDLEVGVPAWMLQAVRSRALIDAPVPPATDEAADDTAPAGDAPTGDAASGDANAVPAAPATIPAAPTAIPAAPAGGATSSAAVISPALLVPGTPLISVPTFTLPSEE